MRVATIIKMLIAACFGISLIIGYYLYTWRCPGVNNNYRLNYRECIYEDPSRKELKFTSCGSMFTINYVEHTLIKARNPTFPSIHIVTNDQCNAWLQIIYTDCPPNKDWLFIPINENLCYRIDTAPKDNDPNKVYPFYTLTNDLYDSPQWNFSFKQRDLSFWRAHAYAVSVNQEKKTISCIGGISWGYKLLPFHFKPKMILPQSLSIDDWKNDWKLFSTVLPDFIVGN